MVVAALTLAILVVTAIAVFGWVVAWRLAKEVATERLARKADLGVYIHALQMVGVAVRGAQGSTTHAERLN